jgi:cytochrome c
MKLHATLSLLAVAAAGLAFSAAAAAAPDADAAQAQVKESGCLTCHSVDKKKAAPSFKDVAKKYKGQADAQDKLVKHITLKPMVDMDGTKVEHKALKNTDPAAVRNVVQWILSL